LHPGARQSSLDDDSKLLCQDNKCIHIDLQPGQALILPAFYFHRVQTISDKPALSVNAYFPSRSKQVAADLAYRADIPIHRSDGLACALFRFLQAARLDDPAAFFS